MGHAVTEAPPKGSVLGDSHEWVQGRGLAIPPFEHPCTCRGRCRQVSRTLPAGVGRRPAGWSQTHTDPIHRHAHSNSAHTTRPSRYSQMRRKVFSGCPQVS